MQITADCQCQNICLKLGESENHRHSLTVVGFLHLFLKHSCFLVRKQRNCQSCTSTSSEIVCWCKLLILLALFMYQVVCLCVYVCLSILENLFICSYCQIFSSCCNEVYLLHASSFSVVLLSIPILKNSVWWVLVILREPQYFLCVSGEDGIFLPRFYPFLSCVSLICADSVREGSNIDDTICSLGTWPL